MELLIPFLLWSVGLPLLLMLDSYIQGRYKLSIFATSKNECWERVPSMVFWPIYIVSMMIWHFFRSIGYFIRDKCSKAMEFCNKKGKQANDLDYQAEKYLLNKDNDEHI